MNRNEIEEQALTSFDNLINEILNVCNKGLTEGIRADFMADYIAAEIKIILRALRLGNSRSFDTIYSEFIDEVVENGQYNEWRGFLRFREGLENVDM